MPQCEFNASRPPTKDSWFATALWSVVLAAGWVGLSVAAQQGEHLSNRLPRVVITGTNYWEYPRSPSAISTLSAERLELAGISSTLDLRRAIPNLAQSHAGLRSFSDNYVVRGLGNTEFLSDPAVVLYVDDAPFGDVVSYTTDLLAIDRVEVYRGPQGSRFGKNSEAGVINIVTRQPSDCFEVEGSASAATFDTQQYRALMLGPVVKGTLHFGLAGQFAKSDGFIHNDFRDSRADERQTINGRASLHWTPGENWNVDFTGTADKFDDGIGLVSLGSDPRHTMSDFDGKLDEIVNSQSLRVRGVLPEVALTSITTRRDFLLDPFIFDLDFTPPTGNTGTVRQAQVQWSEELRVHPVIPVAGWDWRAGFFFATSEFDAHQVGDFVVPPTGMPARDVIDYTRDSDTYALFGECTHTVLEKLDVTLGLRLDYTVRELRRTRISTFGSPPPVHATGGFFNVAPKLTLGYHLTDALLVYGSTGLGFKPGGFSGYIDPPQSPKFRTETAWANEVGVKSTWLEGKVTANATLFYYDMADYQVEQFTPTGFDFTIVNAPEARSLGAELELTARPAGGWEFSGFFGYTDARLDRFTNPFTGTTVRDAHPPFVAEFNAGGAAQYRHRTGLFGRIQYITVGDTFYDAGNTSSFKQPAYGLLNARVGIERGHVGVFLFGENLTDTQYFQKKIPPLNAGAPGQPQTLGVMVTARY